jgi:hypothetical protein
MDSSGRLNIFLSWSQPQLRFVVAVTAQTRRAALCAARVGPGWFYRRIVSTFLSLPIVVLVFVLYARRFVESVFHPIVATEGELRLTRVGANFSMYYRPIGDLVWQLLGTHTRADLPATLQVGMMAYDFNASPDLTVSFDEIVFD